MMSLLLAGTVLGKSNQEVHIGLLSFYFYATFPFTFMRLAVDEKLKKNSV